MSLFFGGEYFDFDVVYKVVLCVGVVEVLGYFELYFFQYQVEFQVRRFYQFVRLIMNRLMD